MVSFWAGKEFGGSLGPNNMQLSINLFGFYPFCQADFRLLHTVRMFPRIQKKEILGRFMLNNDILEINKIQIEFRKHFR